ncbi:hypothetical protein DV736_g6546, partial [Chaetothyriales sp. CBS 134916]
MRDADNRVLPFLASTIDFPDHGTAFELCKPLTNYRVSSAEQQQHLDDEAGEFIVKIKVQVAAPNSDTPATGPSTTTAAELAALQRFTHARNPHVPHLVCYRSIQQPGDTASPLPGGFITFTVMTKLPGDALVGRFWSPTYTLEQRQDISQHFLQALQSVRALAIEPKDCALRNVLWAADIKYCGIIDFELWQECSASDATAVLDDGQKELQLQQWGLARRPVSKDWWQEWSLHMR